MRLSYVRRQSLTFFDLRAGAWSRECRWCSLLRRCYPFRLAPDRGDEFTIVTISHIVACKIVPEIAGCGSIYVRLVVIQREFVCDRTLKIVRSFFAAIADLPRILVVIGGDCSRGPLMAVARDLATVVEIVEYTKLQSQLVLIGGDVVSVHRDGRIAVACLQVPENLVVGAILFYDVNDVPDRIRAFRELNQ